MNDFDKLAGKVTIEYRRPGVTLQGTALLENETFFSVLCSCFGKDERALEVQRLDFTPEVPSDITEMMGDSSSENDDAGMTPAIFVGKRAPEVPIADEEIE